MRDTGVAYLLWLTILLGLGGVHRLYSGKYVTGIIWLFTGGLFFIGQAVDLALIPGMVEESNLKYKLLHGSPNANASATTQVVINMAEQISPIANVSKSITEKSDVQIFLQLAKENGGQVSVTDCVIATGKSPKDVKNILDSLQTEGLLEISNREDTGAIVYRIV